MLFVFCILVDAIDAAFYAFFVFFLTLYILISFVTHMGSQC